MDRGILTLAGLLLLAGTVQAAPAPVSQTEGDTVLTVNDVTSSTSANVVIATANSSRGALNCYTTTQLRWGDTTVSATKGGVIPANTNFVIRNTGTIYVRAVSSAGTVSCTEETFSAAAGGPIFSP